MILKVLLTLFLAINKYTYIFFLILKVSLTLFLFFLFICSQGQKVFASLSSILAQKYVYPLPCWIRNLRKPFQCSVRFWPAFLPSFTSCLVSLSLSLSLYMHPYIFNRVFSTFSYHRIIKWVLLWPFGGLILKYLWNCYLAIIIPNFQELLATHFRTCCICKNNPFRTVLPKKIIFILPTWMF